MSWNELLNLMQSSKGVIKKLAFIPVFPFSIPCWVVSNIIIAFPHLQELKLTVEHCDVDQVIALLFNLKTLRVISLIDRLVDSIRDLELETRLVGRLKSSGLPLEEIVLFPNEPWLRGANGWIRHVES